MYIDKDLEQNEVIFATFGFYDTATQHKLSCGKIDKEIVMKKLHKQFEEIRGKLSAHCAIHRGYHFGTLFCIGDMYDYWTNGLVPDIRLIGGGNLANCLEYFGCADFALYIKDGDLWFKGNRINGIVENYVIREAKMGTDLDMVYTSAKNMQDKTKLSDFVVRNSNSIAGVIKKVLMGNESKNKDVE